jgi:hypothetical protein
MGQEPANVGCIMCSEKICEQRRHRAEGRREGQSVDPAVGLDVIKQLPAKVLIAIGRLNCKPPLKAQRAGQAVKLPYPLASDAGGWWRSKRLIQSLLFE